MRRDTPREFLDLVTYASHSLAAVLNGTRHQIRYVRQALSSKRPTRISKRDHHTGDVSQIESR
jgi:hypothetical protein